MNQKTIQLDIKRYLPFLPFVSSSEIALGVYNSFGREFLFASSHDLNEAKNDIVKLNDAVDWDRVDQKTPFQYVEDTGYIYFVQLTVGADEQKYWLLGFLPTTSSLLPEQIQRNVRIMEQIAACLVDDYANQQTIEGMADELAVRYEELNLLYGMDDIESYYKTFDETGALQHIITNCMDYLNINYAAVYIKDQDYFFHQSDHMISAHDIEVIEYMVQGQIYDQFIALAETVVVNQDSENDWTTLNLHLPYKLIIAPILKTNQKPCGIFVLINEITKPDFANSDRKLVEVLAAEVSKLTQSRRDPVSGQLNRRGVLEQINKVLTEKKRDFSNNCFLLIDLDQFRVVNDSVGQAGGDALLRQITAILLRNIKKIDVLGRIGADEFGIILRNCKAMNAFEIAERIRKLINQSRFFYQEKMFNVSVCMGIVELKEDYPDYSQILNIADLACTIAKDKGNNHIHLYRKSDQITIKHENMMQWVTKINIALEENRFQLYRQKIRGLQQHLTHYVHYEVLIRLKAENGDILSPDHFIPAAERYNLISKIDQWVIQETFKKIAQKSTEDPQGREIYSVNLSGLSFCEEGFSAFIRKQLNSTGISPERICFEITETAAISNLEQATRFVEEIKQLGCLFSLDDFGSGMSSFTYLKNIPVDYLKIDGYFVKSILENKIDRAMVEAIHQIGCVMGLKTIAEFVEDEAIIDELRRIGIHYAQGYGIGRPEPFL